MTRPAHPKRRKLELQIACHDHELLNFWLALDRQVVERAMRAFKIPPRDRSVIRAQQQHLHEGLRQRSRNLRKAA